MNRSEYDVVIAGAGPVGLFLSCELGLAGCSVLILEKAESPESPLKRLPFGMRGLNAPSVESFDRRGLLEELEIHKRMKNPHAAPAGQAKPSPAGGHFAGLPFDKNKVDSSQWPYRLPSSTEPQLLTEMAELEAVLTRRAEALGVEIRRGSPVTRFEQTAQGVTIEAGDQSYQAQWLVGCDGSRSAVRKLGGFEFEGTEPEFTGYTALVDLADPEELRSGRNLTPAGMYLQSQPGYLILQDFDGGAFHQSERPITREQVQEVLRRVSNTDVTVDALHLATTWTDRARQATTYRNGRVLLAGDAAHIHSPLGGQGLNLGLGDAMNLGWKLAATLQTRAPEGLLDSYAAERHPVGVQVLDWSRAQVTIMHPDPRGRALQAIVRDLMDTRDGATYFAGRVWGMHVRYDLGGDHPLVGHSVPNFELEDGTTVGELLRDGRGMLLDFDGRGGLEAVAAGRLNYVRGRAAETFGLAAVLIRPDGFVAWASEGLEGVEEAIDRWFAR